MGFAQSLRSRVGAIAGRAGRLGRGALAAAALVGGLYGLRRAARAASDYAVGDFRRPEAPFVGAYRGWDDGRMSSQGFSW